MKKTLLTAILLGASVAASAQELTFAMEPSYPPFETTNEKGEIIGFDVDVANAICKEIQATCKFKGEAFDALIPNLKAKRLMHPFPLLILPMREQNRFYSLMHITIALQAMSPLKGKRR